MCSSLAPVEHLVIDCVGFINCANPTALGRHLYTVQPVLAEIRDAKTKERLRSLPVQLDIIQPDGDALNFVLEFSKKTGDYASLSKTDLLLIAAVRTLALRHGDSAALRDQPPSAKVGGGRGAVKVDKQLPGFYTPDSLNDHFHSALHIHTDSDSEDSIADLDDETGWITQDTCLHQQQQQDRNVKVACLTSDFAVQNTLVQMGIEVISPDGRTVNELRTFVLRCFSCFHITTNVAKKFCSNCGNNTLTKLSVSYDDDGSMVYHFSKKKVITGRGSKYSLPLFKGGKHAKNPVLFEDQPVSQNKLTKKARQRVDVFDPNYVAGDSPFAVHDLYSRSAVLGLRAHQRADHHVRNPNDYRAGRKRGGKRR